MAFLLHAQRIIIKKKRGKKYSKQSTYHAFLYMLDNLLILFSWYHIYHAFCWWQRGRNIWIDAINTDAMIMPCINLHYALSWYLTMWRNAILAKIFEMCTSCNDIKILLRSFTCWYLTIWWIATITIIQTCYVKFENECQALTSFSERNIMMGIMMGVLISLNNFNLSMSLEFKGFEFKKDLSQVWHVDRGS